MCFCNCQPFLVASLGNILLSRWLELFVAWVTILNNGYAILSPLCCNCVLNGHSWVCDRNPRCLGTNAVPKSQSSLLVYCKLTFLSMWLRLSISRIRVVPEFLVSGIQFSIPFLQFYFHSNFTFLSLCLQLSISEGNNLVPYKFLTLHNIQLWILLFDASLLPGAWKLTCLQPPLCMLV